MSDKNNSAAVKNIVTIGSPILSTVTQKIEDPLSKEIRDLIPIMFDVMRRENGVGLAAPQIGISKQIAVIAYEKTKLILINPQIVDRSDEMIVFPRRMLERTTTRT
jgi:peptide deformylase